MTVLEHIKLTDVSPGSTMIVSPGSTMHTAKWGLSYHLVVRYGGYSGPLSYHLVVWILYIAIGVVSLTRKIGARSFDPFKRSKDLYFNEGLNEFKGLKREGLHGDPKNDPERIPEKRGELC